MMETNFFGNFIITIVTILSSGGVFAGIYWIVKDNSSRKQIGELLKKEGIWTYCCETINAILIKIDNIFGHPFSFKGLNLCLAITFFYTVISLAISELSGSDIIINNSRLLSNKVSSPGSVALILVASILLGAVVLFTGNRTKILKMFDSKISKSKKIYSLIIFWGILVFGWLVLGMIVKAFSSESLFKACLVIGTISVFGSINLKTRIISLIIAFILPFILIYFMPESAVGSILYFLYVIITPLKSLWDWAIISIVILLLKNLTKSPTSYQLSIIQIGTDLVLSILIVAGVAFTFAFTFIFFNNLIELWDGVKIEWHKFYDDSFTYPFSKGVFFTTMCLTSLIPILIHFGIVCFSIITRLFPGKDTVRDYCHKEKTTSLEKAIIVSYLWTNAIIIIIGLILLAILIRQFVLKEAVKLYFASVDLIRQIL